MEVALWRLAMRMSWLLPVALASCAADGPQRFIEERAFAGDAVRDPALLRRTMLAAHSAARAAVGQPPLVWDDTLTADALIYARELARTGRFEHSPQPRGNPNQGENLWTGTRGAYRYDEMAQHWVDERRMFVNRPAPGFSATGDYRDVSHYTQIVWSRTTRVGCAFASNARDDYLVCRYLAAGNVVGERALP